MLQSMSSPWSREESDRQDLVTEQPPPLSSSTGNKAPNQVEDGNSRLSKSPGTLSSYLTTNQSEESDTFCIYHIQNSTHILPAFLGPVRPPVHAYAHLC